MPGSTVNDKPTTKSEPLFVSPAVGKLSKQTVIEIGLDFLREAGADYICRVCITNGGSCCSGCDHLSDGIGCQLRNTSCTAWLCGLLKYVLYEMELLQQWDDFWKQVPGQDYREDFTPDTLTIRKPLIIRNIRNLGKALASDLKELAETHIEIGHIITLREAMDNNIDRLRYYKNDPRKQNNAIRNIEQLSAPFSRFHKACTEYRQQHPEK